MSSAGGPVGEPFASDANFWRSVRASCAALISVGAATTLTALLGPLWALSYTVPAALLVSAAIAGRASSRRSQRAFASHELWRDAERRAVAAALVPPRLRRSATH